MQNGSVRIGRTEVSLNGIINYCYFSQIYIKTGVQRYYMSNVQMNDFFQWLKLALMCFLILSIVLEKKYKIEYLDVFKVKVNLKCEKCVC